MKEALLALLCTLFGITSLYASWREILPRAIVLPAGWTGLALAAALWMQAVNPEFGIVYATLCVGLGAWIAVAMNYESRRRSDAPQSAAAPIALDTRGLARNLGLFVVAVPLSGAAALLVSVAIARVLPFQEVNALVSAIAVLPVAWGLATYWSCADPKILRPTLALAALSLCCALWLFL